MKRTLRGAFTLLEVLACTIVIGLLAALLLPTYSLVKETSRRTVCTEQMRQLGMAVGLYASSFGQGPRDIDEVVTSGQLSENRLLLCPSDVFGGYATKVAECHKERSRMPALAMSYESVLWWPEHMTSALEAADPNHGIIACRLHGARTPNFSADPDGFCSAAWLMYQGPLLRLRKDGSLQLAKLKLFKPAVPGGAVGFHVWSLFTDEPIK